MNAPNLLTLLRIFFVPLLVAALVQEKMAVEIDGVLLTNDQMALAIFLAAAATDLLDGYLARKWGQVTTIGTLLDPIADKLLISAALISLVQVRAVPAWMVILIVGREFAVSGLRSIAAAAGYTISASDLGKTKMIAQVAAVSALMLALRHPEVRWIADLLMWGVVAFSLLSAADYFHKFWRKIDDRVKRRRRRELLALEKRRRKLGAVAAVRAHPE
jgi:CDP-diacylglycerol--glycerol-3-phosphate 3-phosphatidyltransferase